MTEELMKISESVLESKVVVPQNNKRLVVLKCSDYISIIKLPRNRKFKIILTTILFCFLLLIILGNFEVSQFLLEYDKVAINARKKLLVAFIAVGPNPIRNEMLRKNMEMVIDFRRTSREKYIVECIIFVRISRADVPEFARHPTDCRTIFLFQSQFTDAFFHLDPIFLKAGGVDYLILSIDDVYLFPPTGDIDLEEYMDMVVSTNLSVSSPIVNGSPHSFMLKVETPPCINGSVGHTVPFVEIQFSSFTIDAWACFHSLIDLELEFYWHDAFFHEYCLSDGRGVSGVLNKFKVFHNTTARTYAVKMHHDEFREKWKQLHNETLVSNFNKPWDYQYFDRHGKILSAS